ncbi:helix-turn-helix domain-containing protein [Pseudophaeobacter flagellatus]|uniref:helix-turn-helix domain-containing protein n=1 Tax=Pseudophaeobacter flagellatus TaxID=2899119 RepID=UPI0038CDBD27
MPDRTHTLHWAEIIGRKLREHRKSCGLSLEELSRISGSTVPTLSHLERGTRDVKLSTLVSLAGALRIELPELFNEVSKPNDDLQSEGTPVGYDLDDA